MESKLAELRREFETGRRHLAELERRKQDLRDTLLRISGAIRVLEELTESKAAGRGTSSPAIQEESLASVG